jgi:hypothetical protein
MRLRGVVSNGFAAKQLIQVIVQISMVMAGVIVEK